ncbi:adenine deaminase [Enorma phocaeensis]|uniref:adenine deaminase n=1 Tax=Enorma phocaeensis TaxID=1871019 RepID=UPI001EF5A3C0|nr:adenine deaminase C-terminal domain-containing protein [Enorma phocaeensis]
MAGETGQANGMLASGAAVGGGAGALRRLIDVAEGREPADVLFVNARIVDVYGHRVASGRVAVRDGAIASVLFDDRDADVPDGAAKEVVDCGGRYLAPGFIDGHLHIESSNIRPAEYARMALTRGTTTAVADCHEIANVCGLDGLSFMIADARRAPLDIKFMMPSCVPALPDEQAGASISAADMRAYIEGHPGEIFGLGEMMNMPGVYGADGETLERIAVAAATTSGQVDGHAPLAKGHDLNAYAAAGIIADHECTGPAEALDKLSRGMYIMLREGTCSHDLAQLAPLVLEDPARARRCCLATDDRAPSDALGTGMIDNACRMAIEAGIDAVTAISMGTLSTAECFGFDHGMPSPQERRGAIAPGKRADMLLLDDLTFQRPPARVYAAGRLVAADGAFVGEVEPANEEVERLEGLLRGSVRLPRLSKELFSYPFEPGTPAIDVVPGNAATGIVEPEDADGLRRIVLIERHGRGAAAQDAGADGDGPAGTGLVGKHVGRGWVRGYTISGGAIASTIGHDSHNVCVVGDNPSDMLAAVEAVGQGGFVLVRGGEVVARIGLPLGGLMSDLPAEEVARQHDHFMAEARSMGIEPPLDPIMGMIFLPLPVIPVLRIRPEGLFDALHFRFV